MSGFRLLANVAIRQCWLPSFREHQACTEWLLGSGSLENFQLAAILSQQRQRVGDTFLSMYDPKTWQYVGRIDRRIQMWLIDELPREKRQ